MNLLKGTSLASKPGTSYPMRPIFAILLLTFVSCSPNPYRVMSADSRDTRTVKRMNEKFIFLDTAHFENDVELTRLVNVLNKKILQANLKSFNLNAREKMFVRAIEHMRKREYDLAMGLLQSLEDHEFDCQVALLVIDCRKELKRALPRVSDYQTIYDCSQNPQVKALIKQRFRLDKYGY